MPFYTIVGALILLAILALRMDGVREFIVPPGHTPRLATGASAVLLAGLGYFFLRALVADRGDNAYLFVALMGFWLYWTAAPFAVATVLPEGGPRRAMVIAGMALLLVVGALNAIVLVWALSIIPSQEYEGDRVFFSHLVGLLSLLAAVAAVLAGFRLVRQR